MIEVATDAIVALAIVVFALSVLVVLAPAARRLLRRRRARLAERPRLAPPAFVAEAGAGGADDLVAMPRREWRAAEPGAIALLGKVRGEAHTALVEPVARVLEEDPSPDVRRAAAHTLGRMGGRAAVPPLVVALEVDHPDPLRAVAARSLGAAGAAGVAAALAAAEVGG